VESQAEMSDELAKNRFGNQVNESTENRNGKSRKY
jgi:hypothetical protein